MPPCGDRNKQVTKLLRSLDSAEELRFLVAGNRYQSNHKFYSLQRMGRDQSLDKAIFGLVDH